MEVISSIFRSIFYVVTFRLKFPAKYKNKLIKMNDGLEFKIFRHMKVIHKEKSDNASIFIVRFKFEKFSHPVNINLSRIPIPLISGFEGFQDKIWMINYETGYWQGLYQWSDPESIEKYRKSFVLGVMNRRAVDSSISYEIIPNMDIEDYIRQNQVNE